MKNILILSLIFLLSSSVFAWDIIRNKKGSMTGYSTPIGEDIFKQLGIDPNDQKQRLKSPNVMTDLFSAPQANFDYTKSNGLRQTGAGSVGAKTGVTIIYD